MIRAERAGGGNGRVYQITFSADDTQGGSCTGVVRVEVPHSMKPGTRPLTMSSSTTQRAYDLRRALETLAPKTVILHQFDQWRAPIPEGMPEANRQRAQRFAAEIMQLTQT